MKSARGSQFPTALVVNAYSVFNLGDAVILDGLIASLRLAGARHVVVAMPHGPGDATGRVALGADETVPMPFDLLQAPAAVRRFYVIHAVYALLNLAVLTLIAWVRPTSNRALRAYLRADLVVSSGGAYLGGRRPGINLATAFQILLAQLLRRPCIVAPVTVKSMSRPVRTIVARALRGVTVFARDDGTVDRLKQIGIPATLSGDLAFASRPAVLSPPRRRLGRPLSVAVAPRQFGWDTEPFEKRAYIEAATVRVLSSMVRERDARLVLVTQSTADGLENDAVEVTRILNLLPPDVAHSVRRLPPARSVNEAITQYAEADVVYAYRLHAAIIALLAGTPSLVIDYEPKVRGVLTTIGLDDWVITASQAVDSADVAERLFGLATRTDPADLSRAIEIGRRLSSSFVDELARRFGEISVPRRIHQ